MGIFCGSSAGFEGAYVPAAEALGTLVAERGLTVIYGGASIGLMGCVADAALRAGGQVIGVIPNSLQISEITHHDLTDLEIVDTMFQRKERMIELADAFISLPGGIGTLDELFEVLTLLQTGKIQRPLPIYLWNSNWWNQIINWNLMLENGTISADDLNFFEIHDDLDEMFTALITHLSGLPDEPASAP